MEQKVKLSYFNPRLNISMADIRHVYLPKPHTTLLKAEVYRGKLVYKAKGSDRRISYNTLKKGLIRKTIWINEQAPDWLAVPVDKF